MLKTLKAILNALLQIAELLKGISEDLEIISKKKQNKLLKDDVQQIRTKLSELKENNLELLENYSETIEAIHEVIIKHVVNYYYQKTMFLYLFHIQTAANDYIITEQELEDKIQLLLNAILDNDITILKEGN